MSCVNMLERARNWESSDIVAETMPTPRKPATTSLCVSFFTNMPSTWFDFSASIAAAMTLTPSGSVTVAQTPSNTHGAQTSKMKIGCTITTVRKVLASLAVIQCWNRCGNMLTESGTKK